MVEADWKSGAVLPSLHARDIASFLMVAQTGQLGAAADALGIVQPTMTRQIQRVEHALGATLLDRSARQLRLNPRGQAAVPHLEEALRNLTQAHADVQRLIDPERGTVRLDFMHSLGTWMVPALIKEYRIDHPKVHFQLHQGAAQVLIDRLLNDETDIALVGPQPQEVATGQLQWCRLYRQRLALAIPSDHPLAAGANGKPISLRTAADQPFIGMLPGYGTRMLLDELAEHAGLRLRIVFESMELTTVVGLVAAGFGVALLPMDDPYLHIGHQADIVLRPLVPRAERELGMAWRAGAPPPVETFRSFVERAGSQVLRGQ